MNQIFANNISGTLGVAIDAVQTSMVPVNLNVIVNPANNEYMLVTLFDQAGNIEIVKITDTTTTPGTAVIARGQEGTTAMAWPVTGTAMEARATAGTYASFLTLIAGVIASLAAFATTASLAFYRTKTRTMNAQIGITYTFVLGDDSALVSFSNAAAITVTIPPNSSVAFPIGTQIDCIQDGAGKVTFAPGAGVTINSHGSNKAIAAQYVGVSLIKEATDTWYLVGSLIA